MVIEMLDGFISFFLLFSQLSKISESCFLFQKIYVTWMKKWLGITEITVLLIFYLNVKAR